MKRMYAISLFFLAAAPLWAQLYSYEGPRGEIHITDREIRKKGYKLLNFRPPEEEREEADEAPLTGRAPMHTTKTTLSARQVNGLVTPIARAYKVDPELVKAVIMVESSNDVRAHSHKGAMGLMQLIPATAERFGVTNAWDPRQNVKGGVKYLRYLLSYFEGDVDLVLAGYNAGEHAVDRHGGIPPYKETQRYVKKVRRYFTKKMLPYDESIPQRSRLTQTREEEPTRVAKLEQ